jgi:hypothetical protein
MILGSRAITRTRFAAGTYGSDGRFVPGASTVTTIQASVHPVTGRELQRLDEGRRQRQAVRVLSVDELRTDDPRTATSADRVTIDGDVFEIGDVQRSTAVIPHYDAVAVRLPEAP